jgi:predicted nucleic-acid-binding protein
MTGIDTNVLIRFVMADDPAQYQKAKRVMQSLSVQSPGFITQVCIAEFVWVLETRYRKPKAIILEWLIWLVESGEIVLENQVVIERALRTFSTTNSDFSDGLISFAGHLAGCSATVTFDKGAAKATGMRLL